MQDTRIPRAIFFGWLYQPLPMIRAKEEIERLTHRDLKGIHLDEDEWYNKATTSRYGGHLVVLVLKATENKWLLNHQYL